MDASEIPSSWQSVVSLPEGLMEKVERAYDESEVFPPRRLLFSALRHLSPCEVRVVILGQDPYHSPGQADGLAFSVADGVKIPGSLQHIFGEIDLETEFYPNLISPQQEFTLLPDTPRSTDLTRWARQGVLLLNTTLTVRRSEPASHSRLGWQPLTESVLRAVNDSSPHVVFMLWGAHAQSFAPIVDSSRHLILRSSHPSGLSWGKTSKPGKMLGRTPVVATDGSVSLSGTRFLHNGFGRACDDSFFGSMHFAAANSFLSHHSLPVIDWR